MKINKDFGECLRLLLSSTHISNKMLAKVLNIDPSLVSRWIHGKRIPPYYSHYIDAIADYLAKNILTSFQEKKVNALIQELYRMNIDIHALSTKNLIKKLLLEAQAFSMEAKQKSEPVEKISSSKNRTPVTEDTAAHSAINQHANLHYIGQKHPHRSGSISIDQNMSIPLSSQDSLLIGHQQVFMGILDLLKAASSSYCHTNNPIILTFNSALASVSHDDAYYQLFKKNIYQAINRGWKIIFLIHLDHRPYRIIEFIEDIHLYCFQDKVSLYYIKKYDPFLMEKNIIAVPDRGALLGLSTTKNMQVDNAFYFKNSSAVAILIKYFYQLTDSAVPLIKSYSDATDLTLLRRLTEFEEQAGNRYLYTCSLNSSMIPFDLFYKYMKKKDQSFDERKQAESYHLRRWNAFLWQIQHYKYKDICIKEHIEQMVLTHQYPFDEVYGVGKLSTTPCDIKAHLENIIHNLECFDHYEMALISQKQIGFPLHLSWAVKEHYSVICKFYMDINFFKESSTHAACHRDLFIDEFMTVHGFKEKYLDLWEEIAPIYKNKKDILQWLKSQIQILSKICNT